VAPKGDTLKFGSPTGESVDSEHAASALKVNSQPGSRKIEKRVIICPLCL
jgi:hypothetical protein